MAIACSFPNSSDSERGLKKGANALPSPSCLTSHTSISGKSSAVFFPCIFQQDSAQFAFFRQIRLLDVIFRGCSSAGRALRSQCRGQEFDPPHLHQIFRTRGPISVLGFFVVCESFKSCQLDVRCEAKPCFYRPPRDVRNLRTLLSYFRRVAF